MKYFKFKLRFPWFLVYFLGAILIILIGVPLWIITLGMFRNGNLFDDWLDFTIDKQNAQR